ncbi:uncharacterized protein LOC117102643 [Anneissia japonica]|uniref:uncharacterized protein LOC117102643 n=1 Tax=Anneissia japonica TaxID=1529436 RepID=UPI001425A75F|nr:uncharacterized protein LOC117102643 [Anneissia japonica]XP_033099978.1 uncharacterized protein LOC117102643 [Anneissia japonica]
MSHSKLKSLMMLPNRELKEMCRDANMKVSGTKSQLLMRLCGMEKEKPKTRTRTSAKSVNKWLEKQGVKDIESVNKCLRSAIQKGYIDISGDSPLDNVVLEDSCENCHGDVKATIRDLLYQPDHPGYDYGEDGPIRCPNEEEQGCMGMYVTRMCDNNAHFDNGKATNHCTYCPGFSKCLGDYRMEHCKSCGKHFYAGQGNILCECQERYSDSDDSDNDRDFDGCVLQ